MILTQIPRKICAEKIMPFSMLQLHVKSQIYATSLASQNYRKVKQFCSIFVKRLRDFFAKKYLEQNYVSLALASARLIFAQNCETLLI